MRAIVMPGRVIPSAQPFGCPHNPSGDVLRATKVVRVVRLAYQLVVGTAGSEAGVPTYGKPGSVTATPSATASKSSATPHQSDGHSSGASPRTAKVLLGILGVLMVVAGAGGWLLLRRRR